MIAPVSVTAFDADAHALTCGTCSGSGQTREEDDGGSYGVTCEDCAGHGDHRECRECTYLATHRVSATVDTPYGAMQLAELACDHPACIGVAVQAVERRASEELAKIAKRDAARAAEQAAECQCERAGCFECETTGVRSQACECADMPFPTVCSAAVCHGNALHAAGHWAAFDRALDALAGKRAS